MLSLADQRSGKERRQKIQQMPWQIEAALKFGLPAVAAGFLMWFITLGPGNQTAIATAVNERIEQKLDEHIKVMKDDAMRALQHEFRMENYMRQTCANTAKTEAGRMACLSVR